ncbi:unnamed protein product [Citrullus colocynthis]|uniref:Uncharacterized protein n=1 Tax=Citrullus colocynthis TaxID=252529 RepID=A0ABP0XUZ2_9ROSI
MNRDPREVHRRRSHNKKVIFRGSNHKQGNGGNLKTLMLVNLELEHFPIGYERSPKRSHSGTRQLCRWPA